MKRKIISVLLCVCMLAGVMSMAGLALDTTTTTNVSVYLDDPLEIDVGTTEASIQSNISNYINISNSAVTYTNLTSYFEISVSFPVSGTTTFLQVQFKEKDSNTTTTPTTHQIIKLSTSPSNGTNDVEDGKDKITIRREITWVTKLYDLQMGVRKYGDNGNNLVSSNIATVSYETLKVKTGTTGTPVYPTDYEKVASGVVDKLYNLKYDDMVTVTATLKDEFKDYYEFYCWVDGSGNVKQYSPIIGVQMKSSCAVFAVYKEIADRYVVTYDSNEGGKIVFGDGENLKIFEGDGQVSVFEGSSPKFTFVPDEGYEVSKVIVNEDGTPKEVSSIKSLLSALFNASDFDDALSIFGTYADATNKDVYSYTFKNIARNATISVTFIKSKVYEPASGIEYIPGPELSTGSTDVADADGDGAGATTLPAENDGSSNADVVNPQTGSTTAIAAFATLSLAAAAAFVTAKKKRS